MNSKKIFTAILLSMLCCFGLLAQTPTGGVKGTVVNRTTRTPVSGARLVLYSGAEQLASVSADEAGNFLVPDLADGMYILVIDAPEYLQNQVNVTVNDGYIKNMFNLSMTPSTAVAEVDDSSFAEFDMDDSGYNDNPTILFGTNDIFNNIASNNFSAVRFNARGYDSGSQDVLLAGVKMNDAITGYSPYSLWSGLNEAVRSKESVTGNAVSDYGFGGYNGLTNIYGNASSLRKGWRGSVLTNSSLYRLRLMASYASGRLDSGWSYAFNVSARLGGNDWIRGVYYRSFAYYAAVEKEFGDAHRLGLVFFGTPGQRGAQNASTQEVYDLTGDNMYNSNWGYQDGKIRNARVRKTHEPVAILKYDYTPSDRFSLSATLLYRFGRNGYTALDWYDASDPRPDYYRNLPSYFYDANPDMNRNSTMKYAWTQEIWSHSDADIYQDYTHINWDRLYDVNRANVTSEGRRSKYVQEERRVDQRDLNFAASAKYRINNSFTLTGGVNAKINRTENYKLVADLLGGDYFVDIDNFAERDYASDPRKVQNDLDYYEANGHARTLSKGDKYGYDYYAHIRSIGAWASLAFARGNFSSSLAAKGGYEGFWREGLVRKGLFPDNSKGDSEHQQFVTYGAKLGLNYVIGGSQRVYANVGYYGDAPHFNQAFLSPRTRNSVVDDLQLVKTFSSDINYQYQSNGYNVRLTGYYTTIKDQTDVMSFYDDLQNAFTNFAMTGIDQRHIGLELGFKIPTPVQNLFLQGVVAYGEYVYTSNPHMTQTVDNSEKIVRNNELVPYWKSSPVYERDEQGGITDKVLKYQKHHVPSTPQLATSLGLAWNKNYWFIDADVDYFAGSYLDMNPLYRTDFATAGPDTYTVTGGATAEEIEYMTTQEKFKPALLVNLSIGKSWYFQRKYQFGFSLNVRNLLNNRDVKTGGYEQTRLVDNTVSKTRYYKFPAKYFYMSGTNYMLNIYFRF